jgi:hypothetical protein
MTTSPEDLAREERHAKAHAAAVKAGCIPVWQSGTIGWAWHCNCPEDVGNKHFIDQQCSVVKWYLVA